MTRPLVTADELTIGALVQAFLDSCQLEQNLSPGTVRQYEFYLRHFVAWLDAAHPGRTRPAELSIAVIRGYRLFLAKRVTPKLRRPLARRTQMYFLGAIRRLLLYCLRNQIPAIAPDLVELGRKDAAPPPQFLSAAQIDQLLVGASIIERVPAWVGVRNRAIIELAFSTGLRVTELASLDRADLDFDRREFSILGKGRKHRLVFLSDASVAALARYLETRTDDWSPLFIRSRGTAVAGPRGEGKRLTTRSIERMITESAEAAGLAGHITPHTLRHSFATDLLVNGADLRVVQELLGHASLSTTQIYTHVTSPRLAQAHNQFHARGRPGRGIMEAGPMADIEGPERVPVPAPPVDAGDGWRHCDMDGCDRPGVAGISAATVDGVVVYVQLCLDHATAADSMRPAQVQPAV